MPTAAELEIEGRAQRRKRDELLLLALLSAGDLEGADTYWRSIAPKGYADLLAAERVTGRPRQASPPVWFDVDAQRYGIGTRGYIVRSELRNAIRKAVSNAEARAVKLTKALRTGVMPIERWQDAMMVELKQASAAFASVGAGGPEGVSQRIVADVRERLTFQYERLQVYAKQIEEGAPNITLPSYELRPRAYMRHAGTTHPEAERISHEEAGFILEASILFPAEHCKPSKRHSEIPDCPSVAAKGFVPIGTLPQIGSRVCRFNCLCHFEFKKAQGRISEN